MKKSSSYILPKAYKQPLRKLDPVTQAVMVANIREDIARLHRGASLHALMGNDAPVLANLLGRVIYIVCFAARCRGLHDSPEARILASTANALGDLVEDGDIQSRRATLTAALGAIERLMPQLDPIRLALGALELEELIHSTQQMTTGDVEKLVLDQQEAPTP